MPSDAHDERDDGAFRRKLYDGPNIGPLHHNPPKGRVEGSSTATDTGEPAAHQQPHGAAPPQDTDHHGNASAEKQQFYERVYWAVTGAASVCATIATVVAAIYAVSAYRATLDTVRETRDQAEAAREANRLSGLVLTASVSSSVYFGEAGIRMFTTPQQGIKINIIV